jgi:hypothetical protein
MRGTVFFSDIPRTAGSSRWDPVTDPANEVLWSAAPMSMPIVICLMFLIFMMFFDLFRFVLLTECNASLRVLSSHIHTCREPHLFHGVIPRR